MNSTQVGRGRGGTIIPVAAGVKPNGGRLCKRKFILNFVRRAAERMGSRYWPLVIRHAVGQTLGLEVLRLQAPVVAVAPILRRLVNIGTLRYWGKAPGKEASYGLLWQGTFPR